MKKKYINPTIEVVDIKPTALLMNSVNSITGLDGVTWSGQDYDSNNGDVDWHRDGSFRNDVD